MDASDLRTADTQALRANDVPVPDGIDWDVIGTRIVHVFADAVG